MRLRFAVWLLASTFAGCASRHVIVKAVAPGGCPLALRNGVHVDVSVAQIGVPAELSVTSGPVKLDAVTGRQLLIAVDVIRPLPRVELLSNAITILTYGGTLAGWARIVNPPNAAADESIEVQGGWLRVAPFFTGRRLNSHTEAVDVLVVPGGGPMATLALRPGRMWDKDGEPVSPAKLAFTLTPILHMTRLTSVEATVLFRFAALHSSGAHERWECSVASNFPLVDHDSILPDLWGLHYFGPPGPRSSTLALYNPRVGAFRAVFLNLATAHGFARWLSETRARRVGRYELGFIQPRAARGFETLLGATFGNFVVQQFNP